LWTELQNAVVQYFTSNGKEPWRNV
jgi:hypothetical protein